MTDSAIGGYVLAGGRSSRMGRDKSLLEFSGVPLIRRAVDKLAGVCAHVRLLCSDPALAGYGTLVPDLHPDCGPIGGLEAGLQDSTCEWNLFLSVDMPLLPNALVRSCAARWADQGSTARIHMFTAGGRPQPGFCMLHKEVERTLTESIRLGEYKLMRAFDLAAQGIGAIEGVARHEVLRTYPIEDWNLAAPDLAVEEGQGARPIERRLWFANLNTPEELSEAEKYLAAIDG